VRSTLEKALPLSKWRRQGRHLDGQASLPVCGQAFVDARAVKRVETMLTEFRRQQVGMFEREVRSIRL